MTLEHSQLPKAIVVQVIGKPKQRYLRDFVHGAIDGTVAAFAVVSRVADSGLDIRINVVLGLANMVGDGFSIAARNFSATGTDQELREDARAVACDAISEAGQDLILVSHASEKFGHVQCGNREFPTVSCHMSQPVVAITNVRTIEDANHLFAENPNIYHLVVVDEPDHPVGIPDGNFAGNVAAE